MLITRIEAEGRYGKVTIDRPRGGKTVEIVSTVRSPRPDEEARLTWSLPTSTDPDALYRVACQIQRRCDGVRGTGGDISGYFRELERFMD
ncbi:MAG: hypothetical protein IT442_14690 [Phycisphaeraceae bacterium]|nr:hypothetical protein [Phycisphaeraceae bacterium]